MSAATTTLSIARGKCSTWRATQGGWLSACAGCAWVTVEGDPEDYWLAPGEALPVAPGERVRIGGWDETVVCEWCPLHAQRWAPPGPSQRRAGLRAWFARRALRVAPWPRRTRRAANQALAAGAAGGVGVAARRRLIL